MHWKYLQTYNYIYAFSTRDWIFESQNISTLQVGTVTLHVTCWPAGPDYNYLRSQQPEGIQFLGKYKVTSS